MSERISSQKSEQISCPAVDWQAIKDLVCKNPDKLLSQRKKEILAAFDPVEFLENLSPDAKEVEADFKRFRGHVFESLVLEEFNDEEENSVIGNFILNCLRRPKIIGLDRWALKNPDHLGVVIDAQEKIAYITGMYEVKLSASGVMSDRASSQIKNFYDNIEKITEVVNERLTDLKRRYNLDVLPEGGLTIKPLAEIDKFIVIAKTEKTDPQVKAAQKSLTDQGWDLKMSIFTKDDINEITAYLQEILKQKKLFEKTKSRKK